MNEKKEISEWQPVILQFSKSGKKIGKFYSQIEASQKTGVSQSSISACANGRLNSAGGFRWCISTEVISNG